VGSETPTSTPTENLPTMTPTPTASPIETGLDVQPNPLDEFIDVLDVIEWVSRVKTMEGDPDVLFELSVYWQGEYLPTSKARTVR